MFTSWYSSVKPCAVFWLSTLFCRDRHLKSLVHFALVFSFTHEPHRIINEEHDCLLQPWTWSHLQSQCRPCVCKSSCTKCSMATIRTFHRLCGKFILTDTDSSESDMHLIFTRSLGIGPTDSNGKFDLLYSCNGSSDTLRSLSVLEQVKPMKQIKESPIYVSFPKDTKVYLSLTGKGLKNAL